MSVPCNAVVNPMNVHTGDNEQNQISQECYVWENIIPIYLCQEEYLHDLTDKEHKIEVTKNFD